MLTLLATAPIGVLKLEAAGAVEEGRLEGAVA